MAQWVSFDELKSRVSITDVLTHYTPMQGTTAKPTTRGMELRLRCPFHEDNTPSRSISAETGKFHIPPNLVVERVPTHRKPPEVRIWRLSIQFAVGTRPPSTSTPHCPACWARR
jgi:hypothetical protein